MGRIEKMQLAIFGAKSIALGVCKAIRELYKEFEVVGFLVSNKFENPDTLAGLPVYELSHFKDKNVCILIATPEDVQEGIVRSLEDYGFHNHICVNSEKESALMEKYYTQIGIFQPLQMLSIGRNILSETQVYMAKSHKDKPLKNEKRLPVWVIPIQVGASFTQERIAEVLDCNGENISHKNANYSELTALYWIWKNCLFGNKDKGNKYYGLFHYRRWLNVSDENQKRIVDSDVDVILPFPTIYEPDISEHHARYIKESDWDAMLQALRELAPEYYGAYNEIFAQEYLYNYNILIAKADVLERYCKWLFPILERVEELSVPKGSERADRYMGYIGENLLTLYFMYHKKEMNIVYTGRVMLT